MQQGSIRRQGWMKSAGQALALVLAAGGASVPAMAQQRADNGRTVYEAAFFQPFAPATALDIVNRIPGFSLDSGDSDVRGFGQAAGNLVINGQRPSSKADTLETVLGRIPANRVLRVEIGGGDLFGAEFSGKAQVVNLVLTDAGGLSGTAELEVSRDYRGGLRPEGSVSALLRSGQSTFNASAGFRDYANPLEEGYDRIVRLPSRELIGYRRKVNEITDGQYFATLSWAHDAGENRTAHLNGRIARGRYRLAQTNDVYPVGGTIRDDRYRQRINIWDYELGGDITRPLAGGGIKLILLGTRREWDNFEYNHNRIQSVTVGGYDQSVIYRRDEAVARLVWSRGNWNGWNVELGTEGAYNQLDSNVRLHAIDAAGVRTQVDLPVDDAVVTEYRAEPFINIGRSLTSNLRFDVGLTYETSRLTVRGDADAERSLSYLKPKLALDWRVGGGWRVQASAVRTVAQLDFNDFVGAAELSNDRVNGGNPDLVPQRVWTFRASAERPIFNDGRIFVEAGYKAVTQVQDRVPLDEGDGPGNLGNGRQYFASGTLNLPLQQWGIRGGRLTSSVSWGDTQVRDPYTGLNRHFSGYSSLSADVGFRQDLGKFAWGVDASVGTWGVNYWRTEEDANRMSDPTFSAFVEYRPTPRTTLNLSLDNASDVPAVRRRLFFDPDRSSLTPVAEEYRVRNRHVGVSLKLKHNFG